MEKILGITTGLLTLAILFKPFFDDKEGFIECVKFWFTPDILSAFRGNYFDDYWAEFKIIIWLGAGFWVGYSTSNFFS